MKRILIGTMEILYMDLENDYVSIKCRLEDIESIVSKTETKEAEHLEHRFHLCQFNAYIINFKSGHSCKIPVDSNFSYNIITFCKQCEKEKEYERKDCEIDDFEGLGKAILGVCPYCNYDE